MGDYAGSRKSLSSLLWVTIIATLVIILVMEMHLNPQPLRQRFGESPSCMDVLSVRPAPRIGHDRQI